MKTAGQIDGKVSFTAGQFAQCLAFNEPTKFQQIPCVKPGMSRIVR